MVSAHVRNIKHGSGSSAGPGGRFLGTLLVFRKSTQTGEPNNDASKI